MAVETFEKTLEVLKAGGIKQNSAEMDAAVIKKAREEYALEHPDDKLVEKEPEKAIEPTPDPKPEPVLEKKEPELEVKPEDEATKVLTEDEILSQKEDTFSDADKLRKVDILKAREESEKKEISLYAQAEGMTEEEAKKSIEAEKKLAEQYKNDPRKLSRTARYWQSQHAKLESRIKAESEAKERNLNDNEILIQGKKTTFDEAKPLMVEAYRNEFADKVADKSDEEIFEIAKSDYKAKVKAYYENQGKRISDDARSKRARMILELPDHAKPFRKEIEESIGLLPDAKIVQEDYSPDDIIAWARGRHYTPEKLKEIEDSAFKRGQENAKILGEKPPVKPASPGGTPKKDVPTAEKEVQGLTQEQKDRALNMFDGITHWDDQRKFKEYIDVMKSTGRWNPKKESEK